MITQSIEKIVIIQYNFGFPNLKERLSYRQACALLQAWTATPFANMGQQRAVITAPTLALASSDNFL